MTPSGIEPATFRFVEQCLIQLLHRVPQSIIICLKINDKQYFKFRVSFLYCHATICVFEDIHYRRLLHLY
jgi:hypothetical protein